MKRVMNMTYAAVALVGTAVLAGCGTEAGSGSGEVGTDVPVAGVRWVPQKITVNGKDIPLPKGGDGARGGDAHVTFKPGAGKPDEGGGESGGSVGCNSIGADVEVEGDIVRVSDLATTQMGCSRPLQEFEERFVDIFDGDLEARIVEADGGTKTLTLTGERGDSITLRSDAAPPLKGTAWTVNGLVDDGVTTSLPGDMDGRIRLTFERGRVSGDLGCNSGSATAGIRDGHIDLGRLTSTSRQCEGSAMETEDKIRDLFDGTVRYDLRHRALTLTGSDGRGVTAVADRS